MEGGDKTLVRVAVKDDLAEVEKLYAEFNQAEAVAVALGLGSWPNPNVSACLLIQIEAGGVYLYENEGGAKGMAVTYSRPCILETEQETTHLCSTWGYPELSPGIVLANQTLQLTSVKAKMGFSKVRYLELLVTTALARGKGVAGALVKAVEMDSKEKGEEVLMAVATSRATGRILNKRGWEVWRELDCKTFLYAGQPMFQQLDTVTAYMKPLI